MNILKSITTGATRHVSKAIAKGEKHSPEILVGAGIVLGVAACVSACKATLRAEEVLDDIKKDIDTVKEASEKVDEENYSAEDQRKDLAIAYGKGAANFIKLYWKPAALGLASIAFILCGHNTLRKRNLALVALNAGLERKYNTLYSRVEKEFSKEAAKRFASGVENKEVTYTDDKGKERKKRIDLIDPDKELSPYEYIIGPSNPMWTKNMDYNMMWLGTAARAANDQLTVRGHLALSDILPELGVEVTRDDYVCGWVLPKDYYKNTCVPYINFDYMRVWQEDEDGNPEEVILLKLNCDGYIWDKI